MNNNNYVTLELTLEIDKLLLPLTKDSGLSVEELKKIYHASADWRNAFVTLICNLMAWSAYEDFSGVAAYSEFAVSTGNTFRKMNQE